MTIRENILSFRTSQIAEMREKLGDVKATMPVTAAAIAAGSVAVADEPAIGEELRMDNVNAPRVRGILKILLQYDLPLMEADLARRNAKLQVLVNEFYRRVNERINIDAASPAALDQIKTFWVLPKFRDMSD